MSISEYIFYSRLIENTYSLVDFLDDKELVNLALAFDALGDKQKSKEILEKRYGTTLDTDLMGTLAGRYKREWLCFDNPSAADKSLEYYTKAYYLAIKRSDYEQAYYNGINLAFLNLAYKRDDTATHIVAKEVLSHISNSSGEDKWVKPTLAEALLYLDDTSLALNNYKEALSLSFNSREIISMYSQALNIARTKYGIGSDFETKLDALFE